MASNKLSYKASVQNLRAFFKNTDGNSITPEQIYVAAGRNLADVAKNKTWLSNKTSSMKEHDLFTKEYSDSGYHDFNLLVLTDKGIKALKRSASGSIRVSLNSPGVTSDSEDGVSFDSVKRDVNMLRDMFPALEILYDVRLKKEEQPEHK